MNVKELEAHIFVNGHRNSFFLQQIVQVLIVLGFSSDFCYFGSILLLALDPRIRKELLVLDEHDFRYLLFQNCVSHFALITLLGLFPEKNEDESNIVEGENSLEGYGE